MRQIPLRSFLVIPFLLLFIIAAGVIGWMGYRSGQNSLEQFERQMAAEVGARISVHLENFFAMTALTAQTNAEIIRSGLLDPAHPEDMQRHFVADIRHRPQISYVSFGFADGQYIGATRLLDTNEIRLMTAMQSEGMTLDTFDVKPDNTRGMSLVRGKAFDSRKRVWFNTAIENSRAGWYPVYKYKVYDSLGVGFSVPVYAAGSNRLLGVAAADIALDKIGSYLNGQRIASSGIAFVAEPDGKLIATSLADPVFSVSGETVRRFSIDEFPDARIRAAGKAMKHRERATGQSFLDIEGARYLLDVQQFRDAHGLTLLVGVVLSEQDFSGHFESSLKLLMWLSIGVVAIGILIGTYLTGWLVRPINQINRRAEEIADGELSDGEWSGSRVRELDQLGGAFETMAENLRGAFATLEGKVAERTRELELANVELGRLARLDGLTQIANRRSFDALLLQEWRRCLREQQPISLLMIDVDEFKAYNDHYGHQSGDDVLIRVAAICAREMKRPGDTLARYGGEEFVVVMSHTDSHGAQRVAEAIVQAVRDARVPHKASAYDGLTVSVGVATQVPTAQGNEVLLIADADAALYAAKRNGRNRIEVAP